VAVTEVTFAPGARWSDDLKPYRRYRRVTGVMSRFSEPDRNGRSSISAR
jgi:hypothetical protein